MDFALTEDQHRAEAAARAWLAEKFPLDRAGTRRTTAGRSSRSSAGPTSRGGAGLGFVEQAMLLEELGYALYPGPFLQHVTGLPRRRARRPSTPPVRS